MRGAQDRHSMSNSEHGLWRDGSALVMDRAARLPDRCVACNAPATKRLPRMLYWHAPWLYALILVNLLVYALIAGRLRRRFDLEVPLCAHHVRLRARRIARAWVATALGAGLTMLPFVIAPADPMFASILYGVMYLGLALACCAPIWGILVSRPLVARRIEDEQVWLAKCSEAFLSTLPANPSGRRADSRP
jgi:MFS family permease